MGYPTTEMSPIGVRNNFLIKIIGVVTVEVDGCVETLGVVISPCVSAVGNNFSITGIAVDSLIFYINIITKN